MDTTPPPVPSPITVRVKHGSLKCGDLDVECCFHDTVKHLKQIICDKSPIHPEIRDQRLIYAGHLLTDDQTLKDVFGANGGETTLNCFTVHLAYSRMLSSRFPQSCTPPPQPKTPVREATAATNQTNDPQGQRNFSMPYSIPNINNIQMGMNPDLIAMHEFYLRQMMTYMMQWSQISYQVLHSSGLMDPNLQQHVPVFAQPPPVPEPQQPAQNVAPNVAADHGRVNDMVNRGEDDEAPRDMLDWLYTLVRVAFIFSVVYFYSNFTRFFLVVVCTALVVVFQRRQVARQAAQLAANQRQENGANAPPAQPPDQSPPAGENAGNSENPSSANNDGGGENSGDKKEASTSTAEQGTSQGSTSADNSVPTGENQQPAQTVAANVARLSLRDITWTFFTTFFSSLIPEMPQNN